MLVFMSKIQQDWLGFEKYLVESRYSIRDPQTGEPLEHTYDDVLSRIINTLCQNDQFLDTLQNQFNIDDSFLRETFLNNIIEHLTQRYFIPATPFLMNYGNPYTKRPGLFSCFPLGYVDDTMNDIWDKSLLMRNIYMYGGGSGIDISKLRKQGEYVDGKQGISSGPIEFLKLFDATAGSTNQGGRRRGALLVSMDADHPDIYDFINCKKLNNKLAKFFQTLPPDERPAQNPHLSNMNISVNLTEKDFQNEKLLKAIATNMWETGDPGILFPDNMINHSPWLKEDNARFVNPCFSGSMPILTKNGYIPIGSLAGTEIEIWNGSEWSLSTIRETGQNQELVRLYFSDGSVLDCTPYHKFILADGTRKEAINLQFTDKLAKCNYPVIDGWFSLDLKALYTQGFYSGDGNTHPKKRNQSYDTIALYDKKRDLIPFLEHYNYTVNKLPDYKNQDTRIILKIPRALERTWVPHDGFTVSCKLAWLAGLIDADGTKNGPEGGLSLCSINYPFLRKIQLMLQTIGVKSKINILHEACLRDFHDGYGSYPTKKAYRLIISVTFVHKLLELGLQLHRVELPIVEVKHYDTCHYVHLTAIQHIGTIDKVFCFNEPKNHSGVVNGVYLGNCNEVVAPAYLACNLLTVNVAKIFSDCIESNNKLISTLPYSNDFTDRLKDPRIKSVFDEIRKVAFSACILGNYILHQDYGYPDKRIAETSLKHRPVGIGMSGFHTALTLYRIYENSINFPKKHANKSYRYGQQGSCDLIQMIQAELGIGSLVASSFLAESTHSYAATRQEYWIDYFDQIEKLFQRTASHFIYFADANEHNAHLTQLKKYVNNNKLFYNAITLSQAPTGTVSCFLHNLDSGIEPFYSLKTTRRVRNHIKDNNYKIDNWQEFTLESEILEPFMNNNKMINDVITTESVKDVLEKEVAHSISAHEQLQILAAAASLCHTSISKTCNLPATTTVDEIIEILKKTKDMHLKGFTVYRDGSLDNIITNANAKKEEEKKEVNETHINLPVKKELNKNQILSDIPDIGSERISYTYTAKGHHFTTHLTLTVDENKRVREVFIQAGDVGAAINSMFAGLGMAISIALRNNPLLIDKYIKTLSKVKMDDRIICKLKHDKTLVGSSVPNIIGQLMAYLEEQRKCMPLIDQKEPIQFDLTKIDDFPLDYDGQSDICPECNEVSLKRMGSCKKCSKCGYSSC
jgi:ribonucleotide reductase alpha subunit